MGIAIFEAILAGGAVTKSNGAVIINSIEGPDVLRLLGSLLHLPTYSMQMAMDAPLETVPVLTEYYFEKMKAVEPEGPYTIIGYSAGVFAGIEFALKLQASGELTKLVLLDMTPSRFRAILDDNFGTNRADLDETEIIMTMLSQVFGLEGYDIEGILRKEPSLEKRVEKVAEILSNLFEEKMNIGTIQKVLNEKGKTFLQMFDSSPTDPPTPRYQKVVLVKTTQNLISYDSTEFWGLEEPNPKVHILDTTHSYLLTEPTVRQVASSVNND